MADIQRIFTYIVSEVETPLITTVVKVTHAFLSFVNAPLKIALVLYIAFTGILIVCGKTNEAGSALLGRFLKMAIVVWILTGSGIYQQYVYDFFFQILPKSLANALSSIDKNTVSADTFDTVWTTAWNAGLEIWNRLTWNEYGQALIVIIFWGVVIISTLVSFAIWLISRITLALYIAIGPLLVGLILFPATQQIFERWIGSLISCVILQITTIILLYIMLDVEKKVLGAILVSNDTMGMIKILFSGVIFFFTTAFVALQLPAIASSISGGLSFHTGAILQALKFTLGLPGRIVRVANSSGKVAISSGKVAISSGKAIGRGAMAVYRRIRPSPGGSLSDKR